MNLPSAKSVALRELLSDYTAAAAPELIRDEGDGVIRCLACGHRCRVLKGRHGVCHVRFNRDGELRVPWGYVAGVAIDPIEKKPFFHAYPGTEALSFGMLGCDLHCSYCQNWVSSQALRDDRAIAQPQFVDPQRIVELALEHGCPVLTSTYNEPLITSEWAVTVFRLAKRHGLKTAYVSNGNATPEVLDYLRPWLDLYKVDLKGFDDAKYRKLGGKLQNVLDTITSLVARGFWVEVVTLIVPGWNDEEAEMRAIAEFLAGVSREIPWHVTAFHPDYKMADRGWTPAAALRRAADLGRAAGLHYVYAGNVPGRTGTLESTHCPSCGSMLIERIGFRVLANHLGPAGECPSCGTRIPGVWS